MNEPYVKLQTESIYWDRVKENGVVSSTLQEFKPTLIKNANLESLKSFEGRFLIVPDTGRIYYEYANSENSEPAKRVELGNADLDYVKVLAAAPTSSEGLEKNMFYLVPSTSDNIYDLYAVDEDNKLVGPVAGKAVKATLTENYGANYIVSKTSFIRPGKENGQVGSSAVSFGDNNYAGYTCRKVIAYDGEYTLTLEPNPQGYEPANKLAVGDTISIDGGTNYPYCAKITAIMDDNSILVDKIIYSQDGKDTLLNPKSEEHLLYVDGKPNIGAYPLGNAQVSMGLQNHAIAKGAAAFGRKNYASGGYSFAAGRENNTANYAIAMGKSNKANGMFSIALGTLNNTSGRYTAAIGQSSAASAPEAMAIGTRAKATAEGAFALGWESNANGFHSVSINGTATGAGAVSIKGKANGESSFAIGGVASGPFSVALGYANAQGNYSLAANNAIAKGYLSAAFNTSSANGNYSFSAGQETIAGSESSVALGHKTQATAWASMAIGSQTIAEGRCSFAGGMGSKTKGEYDFALGYGLQTSGNGNQFIIGKYNTINSNAIFAIGNGIDNDNRRNIFEISAVGLQNQVTLINNILALEPTANEKWPGYPVLSPRFPNSDFSNGKLLGGSLGWDKSWWGEAYIDTINTHTLNVDGISANNLKASTFNNMVFYAFAFNDTSETKSFKVGNRTVIQFNVKYNGIAKGLSYLIYFNDGIIVSKELIAGDAGTESYFSFEGAHEADTGYSTLIVKRNKNAVATQWSSGWIMASLGYSYD